MKQQTLKGVLEFEGIGLHTGSPTKITIKPAPINHGIKLSKLNGAESVLVNADVRQVNNTTRATSLGVDNSEISTVEHVLAALYGLQVDNALIEVDGSEIPILDGSAMAFAEGISSIGLEAQESQKEVYVIEKHSTYKDEECDFEVTMIPHDGFSIICFTDFENEKVGSQYAEYNQEDNFISELAGARTFVFTDELLSLREQGLIKGGNLNNAIVVEADGIDDLQRSQLKEAFGADLSGASNGAIVNSEGLRYKNEIARHKLLDFLGDLSLLGVGIKGKMIIKKPGHTANIKFLRHLRKDVILQKKLKGKPIYDPTQDPVYDINGVVGMLPHRYPFLLVDKIIELTEDRVVGVKNVTMNENFFQGHFPNNPIFPGVLQMEAMAQTGGILVLSKVEDPQNWDTYFLKLDNVKFKQMVRPGDTVIIKMELLSPVRRGLVHMQGIAYVGNKIVSEGELTAQIVKRS